MDREWRFGLRASPLLDRSTCSRRENSTSSSKAMRGELPDRAMRDRMVKHMESIPDFDKLTQTSWYPGKQFAGLVRLPNPRPIG
jgi:hypothetical protein